MLSEVISRNPLASAVAIFALGRFFAHQFENDCARRVAAIEAKRKADGKSGTTETFSASDPGGIPPCLAAQNAARDQVNMARLFAAPIMVPGTGVADTISQVHSSDLMQSYNGTRAIQSDY